MTLSAQSRIKLSDVAAIEPGVCILCGSAGGDDRKFVDFGKQLDWYGAVYFCSYCIGEVAESVDYIPVDKAEKLRDDFKELKEDYVKLNSKFEALKIGYLHCFSSPAVYTGIDELLDGIIAYMEKSEEPERDLTKSIENESDSSESGSVGGSTDSFDLADIDDEAGF